MSRKCSRKKKIDRAVDNVDFQLFLTQKELRLETHRNYLQVSREELGTDTYFYIKGIETA